MIIEYLRNFFFREFIDKNIFLVLKKNMEPFQVLLSYYRCAMMQVETKFNILNEQFSLRYDRNPIESVKTRLKSIESITKKIQSRNMSPSLDSITENINDIAGVRVMCSFIGDIYMLADCLLQQDDVKLVAQKDYIKNPKPGGYRSLHLIVEVPIFLEQGRREVKVEVQLRTIAMDFWASVDHKIRYKKDIPEKDSAEITRELQDCAAICADMDSRMDALRAKVFNGDGSLEQMVNEGNMRRGAV